MGPDAIIGLSTHGLEDLARASDTGPRPAE